MHAQHVLLHKKIYFATSSAKKPLTRLITKKRIAMKLNRLFHFLQNEEKQPLAIVPHRFVRPATDRLTYHFGDASVPPMYHRSFQADFYPHSIALKVTSYGTVLNQTVLLFCPEDFARLLEQVDTIRLEHADSPNDEEGLCGTTTHSLTLYEKGKAYFSGYVTGGSHLKERQTGTLRGDSDALHATICRFIPHFEEEMKRDI